ncbi:PTS lactose transporter subunit IIB [Lentilactobacillus laojiaonis]|uniref:PTS lactose transporter subunit IIB n=1 Tax=Lentilactobacillus laojiaonis TaxID=2883998 RepID=UPI001D0BC199|nr:PTS lactose transporter subunit IIB [Lentilactobacillus laojiaonis]UDM31909.1 PTS lactose transporter subunit IIB [Lentilactobacillus laojiaonis]
MNNVLLICKDGISSKSLSDSARIFIEHYNLPINLITSDIDTYGEVSDDLDLILVAPQAEFKKQQIKTKHVPVKLIPDDVYGWTNGERLVKFIKNELNLTSEDNDATV